MSPNLLELLKKKEREPVAKNACPERLELLATAEVEGGRVHVRFS